MLTKKYYKMIAEVLNNYYRFFDGPGEANDDAKLVIKAIAKDLCRCFAADNKKFD